LHLRIGLSRFNAICAIGRLRLLVIRNTLRGQRSTPPAFKHLINISRLLSGVYGDILISYNSVLQKRILRRASLTAFLLADHAPIERPDYSWQE
jgi:hypothetical protein